MVQLNKVFVHDDLFYHFLYRFDKSEYENLDVEEMISFIEKHIPDEPRYNDGDHISHEAYLAISVNNSQNFTPEWICKLDEFKFYLVYMLSITYLKQIVYSHDKVYEMIETGEIDDKFKLKDEHLY